MKLDLRKPFESFLVFIAICVGGVLGNLYFLQMAFPALGALFSYFILSKLLKEAEYGVVFAYALLLGMLLSGIASTLLIGKGEVLLQTGILLEFLFVVGSLVWFLYKNNWSLIVLLFYQLFVLAQNFRTISLFESTDVEFKVLVVIIHFRIFAIIGLLSGSFCKIKLSEFIPRNNRKSNP